VEGAAVKEEFHFRIERLYYEEKVLGQSNAADLGSQHAALSWKFNARAVIDRKESLK
jgi:hypothetical protein